MAKCMMLCGKVGCEIADGLYLCSECEKQYLNNWHLTEKHGWRLYFD